jgi:spore germination protein
MKRLGFIAAVVLFFFACSLVAHGGDFFIPRVEIDGIEEQFARSPIIEGGRVLVPVRSVFSRLGAQMAWNGESREVLLNKDSIEIVLQIDKKLAKINGVEFELDIPAKLIEDFTYVPLRFVTQAFGYKVGWDQEQYLVSIMTASEQKKKVEVYGYYGFGSYNSLQANPEKISTIAPMWFTLNEDGSIKANYPQDYQEALVFCRQNGIKIDAVLFQNNTVFLEQLLASPDKWDRVCLDLEAILLKDDFNGVNLDLEGIPNAQREQFLKFVAHLSQFVKGRGKNFSLSLPAKTSDNQSWYVAYDYGRLSSYADYFVIMAYDQHYAGGQPGPVAGIKWVEQVIKYSISKIDPGKLVLACGLYGYDWPNGGRASVVDSSSVKELVDKYNAVVSWDEQHYSPYLKYTDNGTLHTVWFENEKSIAAKLSLVDKYQLKGLALWRLGLIAEPVWNTISTKYTPVKNNY